MKKCVVLAVAFMMVLGAWAQSPLRSKKYKGFLNFDLSTVSYHSTSGDGNYSDGGHSVHFELTTSHGIQVCPYFFAGAGVGLRAGSGTAAAVMDMDFLQAPIFLQVRGSLTPKPVTPYLDLKGGYSVGDMHGAFVSPSIGVSVPLCNRLGLNVEVAYQAQNSRDEYTWGTEKVWRHAVSVGVGLEF